MPTRMLHDEHWSKIVTFLRSHPRAYVGDEAACRRFVEAVRWIGRTGAQWRELFPNRFGHWNSVYKRYARWCAHSIWDAMHPYVASDPDLEYVIPDSPVIRAHPCAAGAPAKKGGNPPRRSDEVVADSARRSISW